MRKLFLHVIAFSFLLFFQGVAHSAEAQPLANPVAKFLKNIEYTSRIKLEYDDNIFLNEDASDSDLRPIFTQTMTYKLPTEKQYFQLGYSGNYSYYTQESVSLLGHGANLLYSYRPFDGFSIGFRDDFNWLSDSKIASTIGDRVLSLGYTQNVPAVQMKYELNPRSVLTTDAYYQSLDARDPDNDDYIDNKRLGFKGQVNYDITENKNFGGILGFEHKKIDFTQIDEKIATSERPFVGFTQRVWDLLNVAHEVGFEHIDMKNNNNTDDSNIDYRISLETISSLYTKVKLSFNLNTKSPSLRRQYAQYGSNLAALSFSHAFDPKTVFFLDYSFEKQKFNEADALAGQAREDKRTHIQNLGLTLSRKLNSWLTMDFKYDYTKRDTDFGQEGYIDNKLSTGLTAKY